MKYDAMLSRDDTGINGARNPNNKKCSNQCTCCMNVNVTTERSDFCLKLSWFLIGVGFLFPYNSVVTAIDFFAKIYFPSIDFILGWLLLAPSMAILFLTLKYGYYGSIYQRIIATFVLEGLLTILIPLVRNVYVLYISTFILGCLSAVLQGTLFSLLGFLGSDIMSITQTGIGSSGALVGIVRIITKVFIASDIRNSTYLYFLLAFIMVFIDIAIYIVILHPSKRLQKAVQQDTQKNESLHAHASKSNINTKRIMNLKVNEITNIINISNEKKKYDSCNQSVISSSNSSGEQKVNNNNNNNMSLNDSDIQYDQVPLSLISLFCCSWRCQIAVFLNYTLTLSLFPGVISLMKWDNSGDEWFAVIQIFLFNFFDTIGKNLTTYKWILNLWTHNTLLIASICRLIFVPLFVMCVEPAILSWQTAIAINALMGVTNGLVGTSGFCLGPQSQTLPKHEKGRTAQMLAVALTCGLVAGASLAFLIDFVMDNYL